MRTFAKIPKHYLHGICAISRDKISIGYLEGHVTESNGASWEASVRSQVTAPGSRGNGVQLWSFIGHCIKEAKPSFFGVVSKRATCTIPMLQNVK